MGDDNDSRARSGAGSSGPETDALTSLRASEARLGDVTEQGRLEEELRLARFSLEHCADAVFWIGPDAKFVYVNQAACDRLGFTREELCDRYVFDIDPNFPRHAWEPHWRELQDKRVMVLESVHRCKDGSEVPVEIMASYLEYHDRAYNCALARDISERRRAAEQLQQAHDRLEQRVQQRTVELQRANDELKDVTMQLVHSAKLAALGELTAGIAHELNQPLNAMKITCQGLLRDADRAALVQSNVTDKLATVVGLIDKMAAVILHMRVFTRQSRPDERRLVDLLEVIESAFGVTEQQLRVNGVEVTRELCTHPLLVRADAANLEQVVLNLLSNARWALMKQPPGGRRLLVSARAEGAWAVVCYLDTGVGIAEDAREKIFQPFFTTKDPGEGTGLGLSVASKIVEEHGGTLELLDENDGTTCFELRLPLVGRNDDE